jgi:hypothetical protein
MILTLIKDWRSSDIGNFSDRPGRRAVVHGSPLCSAHRRS